MEFLGETGIVSYFSRLLPFGRLADDSQGILAAIDWDAFMSIKSGCDFGPGFGQVGQIGPELGIATCADTEEWRRFFNEAERSPRHTPSLPPPVVPVDFKRTTTTIFQKLPFDVAR